MSMRSDQTSPWLVGVGAGVFSRLTLPSDAAAGPPPVRKISVEVSLLLSGVPLSTVVSVGCCREARGR
jgi:hypothetical protein